MNNFIVSDNCLAQKTESFSDLKKDREAYEIAKLELERFFILIRKYKKPLAIMSKLADDIWHAMILFTPQYRKFCELEFGTFIDHQPNTESTPISEEAIVNFYTLYAEEYGEISDFWILDFEKNDAAMIKSGILPQDFSKKYKWSGWPGLPNE